MAKIKMSSIGITAISGKAGGSVYSRNRGGEYVKNFVMPTNTITQARQAVRAVFGGLASGWRNLTQSQRNTWIEQAPNYLRTNTFGDQKQLQPNALYVGLNTNLLNAGLSGISEISAPQGAIALLTMTNSQFDLASGTETWDFTGTLDSGGPGTAACHYVLEAAPPHSQSLKNVQNKYRVLAKTTDISPTPIPGGGNINQSNFFTDQTASAGAYIARFGEPKEGDVISYRIKAVNPVTGEVSAYFYHSDVVVDL